MPISWKSAIITFQLVIAGSSGALAASSCKEYSAEVATEPVRAQYLGAVGETENLVRSMPSDADIILVGDSQMAAWGKLAERDFPGKKVWNFGVGRDRTNNTIWRLNQLQPAAKPAQAVLVLVGTNNFSDGFDGCGTYEGIKVIAKKSKEIWNAPVFVITIPPRGADFIEFEQDRIDLNNRIGNIRSDIPGVYPIRIDDKSITCGKYGQPALPGNTLSCMPDDAYKCTNYSSDNLHLADNGFKFLKAAVALQSKTLVNKDIFK